MRRKPSERREVSGVITIVQEDRFRLIDVRGNGYLFTLGRRARATVPNLLEWRDSATPLHVTFSGRPDLGAVATRIKPTTTFH